MELWVRIALWNPFLLDDRISARSRYAVRFAQGLRFGRLCQRARRSAVFHRHSGMLCERDHYPLHIEGELYESSQKYEKTVKNNCHTVF
jgi:hypothetical protein